MEIRETQFLVTKLNTEIEIWKENSDKKENEYRELQRAMSKMQAQHKDDIAMCERQMGLLESKIEDLNRSNKIETLRIESDSKKNLELMK